MRIAIASDLHAEFMRYRLAIPTPEADLWIFAGDIGIGGAGIDWIREIVPEDVPIVYIAGNHEFYGTAPVETERASMAARARDCGVAFLENAVFETEVRGEPLRVLGCTLWTDFALFGEDRVAESAGIAGAGMMDFRLIRHEGAVLTPADTIRWHEESRAFLERELAAAFEGRTLVVTHHAPVREAARYQGDYTDMSPAFGSDLRDLVARSGADLWVFGHTHSDHDEQIGKTRLVARQGGYPATPGRISERESRGQPPFEPLVVAL